MERGNEIFINRTPETSETGLKGGIDRGIQNTAENVVNTIFGRSVLEPMTYFATGNK